MTPRNATSMEIAADSNMDSETFPVLDQSVRLLVRMDVPLAQKVWSS